MTSVEYHLPTPSAFQLLAWVELPWVLLLSPLVLLPGRFLSMEWHGVLLTALLVPTLTLPLFAQNRRQSTLHQLACWLFVGCLGLGLWVAVAKPLAWETAGYVAFGVALYAALLAWPPLRQHPAWILWALLGVGSGLSLLSITALGEQGGGGLAWLHQFLPHVSLLAPLLTTVEKLTGVVNINIFAAISAFLLPLYLALCLHWQREKATWLLPLWSLLLVATGVLLLASESRGGLLAAGVGAGVVIGLRWPRLLYLLIFAPLLGAALVSIYGHAALSGQLQSALSMGGLSGRQDIWYRALLALEDFSFTGIGLGMFAQVIPVLYPYSVLQQAGIPHAHNLFLQVGLDLGIPGLLAYLGLWGNGLLRLGAALRRPRHELAYTYALGVLGSVAAILVNGAVDIALWGTKLTFLPWMVLALAVQLGNRAANPLSSTNHGATAEHSI